MGVIRHWERRLATGANAVVVAIAVVLAIGLLVDVAARSRIRWDLTSDGSATLLPETRAVLRRLDERGLDVRITGFTAQRKDELAVSHDRQLRDFLRALELASPRIRAEVVDLDRDRLTAERLGIDRYGSVVIEAGGDRVDLGDRELFRRSGAKDARTIGFIGEGAFVRGLEQLLSSRTRRVVALTGHGELVPFDRGLGDLHGLADVLSTLGLEARTLDLLTGAAPEVPRDAEALLAIAPRAPLTPSEQVAVRAYLARGGGVALFLEPGAPIPELIEDYGLTLESGVVMDARSMYPWEDRPLLAPRRHGITEDLAADGLSVVAGHAAALVAHPVDGVVAAPLLGTTRSGWIERGQERPATFDEAQDGAGPVDVAFALSIGPPFTVGPGVEGRLVVVGDGDLVGDPLIDEGPGNRTFAAAAMRWLVRDDVAGTRIGAPREVRRLVLTPAQLLRVRVVLVGVLPLGVLLVGALVRWRRRA